MEQLITFALRKPYRTKAVNRSSSPQHWSIAPPPPPPPGAGDELTPVPPKETSRGDPFDELLGIDSDADCAPAAPGANVTLTVQVLLGAND